MEESEIYGWRSRMYRKMLVPLDGSQLAEVVFPYAKELAGRLDLEIILLHVYSPAERESGAMHRAYIDRVTDIIRRQSKEVEGRMGVQPEKKAVQVQGEVAEGYPAEEILRYADKNDVDLILIATHGRSGVRRWAMGSVADKVLRASKVPVWLARAGIHEEIVYDKWPKRTVLVPLDGSELAESVLPHAEALAKQRGAELVEVVLVRVCEPPVIPADYPEASMPLSWEEHVEQVVAKCRHACEQYLAEVEKGLKDAGLEVRSEVLVGKPGNEIVDYVNRNPFNLIVMSTHGRSGLGRWAYGSIADKVLHGVSSPIFLVRPR